MSELVNIGDTIVVIGPLGNKNSYPVTRVTKTLAMSKRKSDGYEYRFKRVISWDMSHPYEEWNRIKYTVIKPEQTEGK